MKFEREGVKASVKPIENPSDRRLARELSQLRSFGPSTYACLSRDDGSYVQVAGGNVNCALEWRDTTQHRHFRAFQEPPVVPYRDGTKLIFCGGHIELLRGEWFFIKDVILVFTAFLQGLPFPEHVQWRDVTEELASVGISRP